jgi:hypothetical protein
MDPTTYKDAVMGIERLLTNQQLSREDILCVLLKVTVNAIHVIEDKRLREMAEREYVKALGFVSALEERKQIYPSNDPPSYHDVFVDTMMTEIVASLSVKGW